MNLSRTDGTDQYVRRKKLASCGGQSAFFLLLSGLMLLFGVIGLKHGAVNCSLEELLTALFSNQGDETLQYFVRHLRLPRIISALAVGGVLAVNGVILQNVLNNPLASSFTLGLSQGAAFGASFALIALSGGSFMAAGAGISLVTLCAFIGSTLSSLLIMSFTLIRGMTPQGLILAGVALATLLSAATMSLQYFATDTQVAASLFWTFGDLSKGTWTESIAVSAVLLCTLTLAFGLSLDYDALKWGDAQATGLGVDVKRVRFLSLLLTALSTAVATAFYGVIGFVGLIAPHMIRLIFPHAGHGFLLPAAAMFGGCFILAADLLAQWIIYPQILPIGILCAFAGVPMFLFLLFKRTLNNA